MDISAVEEHVDRAEGVLLAEPESAEAGDSDLGAEQRETGQQGVGSVGAAELVGGSRHGADLTRLRAEARIDVVRRRTVEDVRTSDLQAVQRIDASVEPAEAPREFAHGGELSAQVFAAPGGEQSLRSLLHHGAAVLDAPLGDRHVADGRQDVRAQP